MRNYSVCYLDAQGRTQRSEMLPFEDNRAAIDFARIGMISHAIVEVWCDNNIVERLYRNREPIVVPRSGPEILADPAPQPAPDAQ